MIDEHKLNKMNWMVILYDNISTTKRKYPNRKMFTHTFFLLELIFSISVIHNIGRFDYSLLCFSWVAWLCLKVQLLTLRVCLFSLGLFYLHAMCCFSFEVHVAIEFVLIFNILWYLLQIIAVPGNPLTKYRFSCFRFCSSLGQTLISLNSCVISATFF